MGFIADLRSLALFRISLALVTIFDLGMRIFDLRAFYSDDGVLPRELYRSLMSPWQLSLHMLGGSYAFQLALFLLTLAFAFAYLLGFRTRYANFGLWLLVLSYQQRNDFLLYGGDAIQRLLLFWSMFSPVGARFSLDAVAATRPANANRHLSFGATAIFVQMVLMYLTTGLLKSDPVWWKEGTALYYTLNIDAFVGPLGRGLLNHPRLLTYLGWSALALEIAGPILALITKGRARILIVAVFVLFHLSLFTVMDLGIFSFVSIAGWMVFLPADFWVTRVGRLIEMRLTPRAPAPTPPLPAAGPRGWLAIQIFLAVCLSAAVMSSLAQFDTERFRLGKNVRAFIVALGLGQHWNMFAPFPMLDDGWFVFEGTLADGTSMDVFRDEPTSFRKPSDVSESHRGYLWYTYLGTMWREQSDSVNAAMGRYFCREWNQKHPDRRMIVIDIHYFLEMTPPPGEPIRTPVDNVIHSMPCD